MALVQRIGFFLVPGFSMTALSCATEPLRFANRIHRRELYSWHLISRDGQLATSNNGFTLVPDLSIDQAGDFSLVLVVASLETAGYRERRVIDWLRRLSRTGCRLGAVCSGTTLLARAGLLQGYRCTLPWQLLEDFSEEFPEIAVARDLFCIDRDRLTCAGGIAVLDLMLALITEQHGQGTAAEVAEQLLHTRIRHADESQRMPVQWRYELTDRRMVKAVTLMEQNMERPMPILGLARTAGISPRELERLFNKQFGCSPSRFYLRLRLKHAHMLLTQSTEPILDIALRCGFADASHLGRCYAEAFDETPAQARRNKQAVPRDSDARH